MSTTLHKTTQQDIEIACLLDTHTFELQHPDEAIKLSSYALSNAVALRNKGDEEITVCFDTWSVGAQEYYNDVLSLYATTAKGWE